MLLFLKGVVYLASNSTADKCACLSTWVFTPCYHINKILYMDHGAPCMDVLMFVISDGQMGRVQDVVIGV